LVRRDVRGAAKRHTCGGLPGGICAKRSTEVFVGGTTQRHMCGAQPKYICVLVPYNPQRSVKAEVTHTHMRTHTHTHTHARALLILASSQPSSLMQT